MGRLEFCRLEQSVQAQWTATASVAPSVIGDANAKGCNELAQEKEVKHVPNILDGILSQPSLMSDYVHPNDAGYAKIAERLENELKPLLPKLEVK